MGIYNLRNRANRNRPIRGNKVTVQQPKPMITTQKLPQIIEYLDAEIENTRLHGKRNIIFNPVDKPGLCYNGVMDDVKKHYSNFKVRELRDSARGHFLYIRW